MILSRQHIKNQIIQKRIVIDPLIGANIGPNSVDLRIGKLWEVTAQGIIDPADKNSWKIRPADEHIRGQWLIMPGRFYLGETIEYTETDHHVPQLIGRSSWARLGLSIYETAGFGDIGFHGKWTLEITSRLPIIVRKGDRICQIYYNATDEAADQYSGKYRHNKKQQIVASEIDKDYKK